MAYKRNGSIKSWWNRSIIREYLIKIQRAWYVYNGDWLQESWCNYKLTNIEAMRKNK